MRKVYYHRIQNMQHAPGLNGNVVALCNPQTGNEFLEHLPDMTREQYEHCPQRRTGKRPGTSTISCGTCQVRPGCI
jgi:hypothetical protein